MPKASLHEAESRVPQTTSLCRQQSTSKHTTRRQSARFSSAAHSRLERQLQDRGGESPGGEAAASRVPQESTPPTTRGGTAPTRPAWWTRIG
jgi:hypothetical protein